MWAIFPSFRYLNILYFDSKILITQILKMKTFYDRLSARPAHGISALELNDLKQNCLIAMNLLKANEMLVGYGKGAFLAHIARNEETKR